MSSSKTKLPIWFWVISVLILIWNLYGVLSYLGQAFNQVAMLEDMTQMQREVFESIPAWATACFAIAVFSGTAGAIALLLKKKWAKTAFIISLVAAVAQFINWLFLSDAVEAFGPSSYTMPIIVTIVGVLEILLAKSFIKKGWLT